MLLKEGSWAFTVMELGIAISVAGIMAAIVLISFQNAMEDADKVSLEAGLSTFQNVLVEGSQRSEVPMRDIDLNMVIAAIEPRPQYEWTFVAGADPQVTLKTKTLQAPDFSNARSLTFRVSDCGTVCPVTLSGFNHYKLMANPNHFCAADTVARDCKTIVNN